MNTLETPATLHEVKNHDLTDDIAKPGINYEKRPAKTPATRIWMQSRPTSNNANPRNLKL